VHRLPYMRQQLTKQPIRAETTYLGPSHSAFGSEQESGKLCILRGLLKNQEFHSLSLILLSVPKNPLLENPR
jgi:hypothetical protein